ncbi:VOC family protein [Minwuia sp.]|uniref:VOC family protein n=1 Tax=Minwuia sp. TaxID=2493630 RepID=UPI003A8DF343
MISASTPLRVVRPTRDIDAVHRFYVGLLGLTEVYRFEDKDGFDGLIVSIPGADYQLAFTRQHTDPEPPRPGPENQIVFYMPDRSQWQRMVNRLAESGVAQVRPGNPYWLENGATFEDPDGYRIVLQNAMP